MRGAVGASSVQTIQVSTAGGVQTIKVALPPGAQTITKVTPQALAKVPASAITKVKLDKFEFSSFSLWDFHGYFAEAIPKTPTDWTLYFKRYL